MPTTDQSQENRLGVFANLFKGYMSIMPMVTAALAPLLTAMNVLPGYESQRKPLAVMAGVLGFLMLAWLFYVRRTIALGSITPGFRWIFNLCPLALVLGSVRCYVGYSEAFDESVSKVLKVNPSLTWTDAVGNWSNANHVPSSSQLQLLYLGLFLFAEAAFVMMALREYANDVRRISEYDWMFGTQDGSPPAVPGALQARTQAANSIIGSSAEPAAGLRT